MTIPLTEPLPSQYYIKATSDRWLGSVTCIPLNFQHLILPESHPPHTGVYCLICGFMNFTEYKKVHIYYNQRSHRPILVQIEYFMAS